MKTETKKIVIGIILLLNFITMNGYAQDIHFSQFWMTPLLQNPSLAGKFGGDYRGTLNYRNQWSSVTQNPFVTMGGVFDMPVYQKGKQSFWGGGIGFYKDKAGASLFNTTQGDLSLAYHLSVDNNSILSGGMNIGFLQRGLNLSDLRFDNQFDGSGHNPAYSSGENIGIENITRVKVSAGMSYSWVNDAHLKVINNNGTAGKKISTGIAVHQVNSPAYVFTGSNKDKYAMRYVAHFSSSFGIDNTPLAIQPMGYFAYQNMANELLAGCMIRQSLREQSHFTGILNGAAFSLGAFYRSGDAFIVATLFEFGSMVIGVSYDVNTSSLSKASNGRGGYEISLRYISPNPFTGKKSQARFF